MLSDILLLPKVFFTTNTSFPFFENCFSRFLRVMKRNEMNWRWRRLKSINNEPNIVESCCNAAILLAFSSLARQKSPSQWLNGAGSIEEFAIQNSVHRVLAENAKNSTPNTCSAWLYQCCRLFYKFSEGMCVVLLEDSLLSMCASHHSRLIRNADD